MEILGHSQIRLTMNTYSHVIPALKTDAADRMQTVLSTSDTGAPALVPPVRSHR